MLWLDLRYGLRSLRHQPAFALLAVVTLAFGIGAATTIFSVIQNVLLDPFPYKDADRVVMIQIRDSSNSRPGGRSAFQGPEFLDYQEQNHVFEDVIGGTNGDVLQTSGEGTEQFTGGSVTPNLFAFLGVPAQIGRVLVPDDAKPGAPPVFVMAHKMWLVSDGYLPTLGLRLVRGRTLSDADINDARKVAVVNQTLVSRYFPQEDPIGRSIKLTLLETFPGAAVENPVFEIVGVMSDAKNRGLQEPPNDSASITRVEETEAMEVTVSQTEERSNGAEPPPSPPLTEWRETRRGTICRCFDLDSH